MSGLCGWFQTKSGGEANPQLLTAMSASINRFDAGTMRSTATAYGSAASAGRSDSAEVFQAGEQIAAIWGRPRFTDEELAALAQRHGMAQALAQGYARKRAGVLACLSGNFAIAILDGRSGEAMLAIDRMGINPLCYQTTQDGLIFGSTCDAINAHPLASRDLSPQGIFNYVYFHMVPSPGTIFQGIRRLLPGQCLLYASGRTELRSYWKMHFDEERSASFAELKDEFIGSLREAVRASADGARTGCFLSGGTDSSTVAGMLGEVSGEPARTYSIGFDAQGYDEMEYARIAAKHFGTQHHEYYVTPDDVVRAIPLIADVYDQPFGNSSAVPTYYCAKLAREDGIERLLGGDGGDELFGGNERYAKQRVFDLYSAIPAPLRNSIIEPLVNGFPAGESIMPVRKLRSYIRQAKVPMPERIETYNLLGHFGHERVFTAEFLREVDAAQPIALLRTCYHAAAAQSLINRMLAFDFQFTLADNDLPKVERACELAGIEVAFPMLDDAVVAFSGRLAPDLKLKRTVLRYFFKEALRDFLPKEIIAKKKHGFGLPFDAWLRNHKALQQVVFDSLSDLKNRRIVRVEFIDELISPHARSDGGYSGKMCWVIMMLEQWCGRHRNSH